MEDKFFDLLEKMYVDLSGKIGGLDGKIEGLRKEMIQEFEKTASKLDIVRLENKMDDNHRALQDGYKLTFEKLNRLEDKVDKIDKKVERNEVEIRVIKSEAQ